MHDNVNHPSYYKKGNRKECIIEMQELYGIRVVIDFCIGNCFKYLYRRGDKICNSYGQDTKKALWYLRYAKKLVSNNMPNNLWYVKEFENLENLMKEDVND